MSNQLDIIRSIYRDRKPGPINRVREFAVLIPLIEGEDGEVRLLFETRAADLDVQPDEICFPGGAMEEGESPLQCALRETYEEIGVAAADIEILGQMDTLNNPGLSIYVFVGVLKSVRPEPVSGAGANAPADEQVCGVSLSSDEVAEVFTVPLSFFLQNEPEKRFIRMKADVPADFPYEKIGQTKDYPWRESRYSVLIYNLPGRHFWGMTAKIAARFAELLAKSDCAE